jgi:RIP metalloprotease RseP
VTPEVSKEGTGKIGVMLAGNGEVIRRRANNVFQAFGLASDELQRLTSLTVKGFGQLITNFKETSGQVAGPVAIVAVGAQLAQDNLANLLQFGALISINLAIINILPLPALDGGQLAFLIVEGLFGKPVPSKVQDGIMQTGLVLLLGLGVLLIVRDTANLAFFQQLLQ